MSEGHRWDLFFSWMWATALTCAFVASCSRLIMPRLVPIGWASMLRDKPHHRVTVAKHPSEWVPGLLVPYLVWNDVVALTQAGLADPIRSMRGCAPPGVWAGTGALLGYMMFDCFMMSFWAKLSRKSNGPPMYMQLWAHHVLSIALWPLSLHSELCALLVSWFLLSEGTNLLLTLRAIMLKLDHARTKAFVPVSALWLLSFVVVRIVPLPMLVWLLYVADFTGVPMWLSFLAQGSCLLPFILNLYWLGLALDALFKTFRRSTEKGGAKAD